MKLIIVRHGDPDYTIDSLTEKVRKGRIFGRKIRKTGSKRVLCFSIGKGKRYCILHTEKGGKNGN